MNLYAAQTAGQIVWGLQKAGCGLRKDIANSNEQQSFKLAFTDWLLVLKLTNVAGTT